MPVEIYLYTKYIFCSMQRLARNYDIGIAERESAYFQSRVHESVDVNNVINQCARALN